MSSRVLVRTGTPLLEFRAASACGVRELSIALQAGDRVALVCRDASERETLLELCLGARPTAAGLVRVLGSDAAAGRSATTGALGLLMSQPSISVDGRLAVEDAVGAAGEAPDAVRAAIADAGLPPDEALLERHLHTLDRRTRARVALAAALAHAPVGLVAEDPFELAPVDRADLLGALAAACSARALALLLLTPDLAVATTICRRVAIVLGGRIVEEGPATALAGAPRHPYTRDLAVASGLIGGHIASRAGTLADEACAFSPLCPNASARCRSVRPPLVLTGAVSEGVACWHPHAG